mgnify:CR=1 FL=1
MAKQQIFQVIGCMSGTSVDGVDLALLETDGKEHIVPLDFAGFDYAPEERAIIKAAFGIQDKNDPKVQAASQAVTDAHIRAIKEFGHPADLIGFHGQTIFHAPQDGVTLQIGDATRLAAKTGTTVIHDFRSADVAAGGEGAPLLPLYHAARLHDKANPAVILNIGGVANVTWIHGTDILAFDTGPGNALIDDVMIGATGQPFDKDGVMAASGTVDHPRLNEWLDNLYFKAKPPKSLDRDAFSHCDISGLSVENAIATLTAFTAYSIAASAEHFPRPAAHWYVTGGGRKNRTLMAHLSHLLKTPMQNVEDLGWNGDAIEAEGFAYLAVRSNLGLPLSLPTTTGCTEPLSGGETALP